ncbi:Transcription initiation factor TFIID subunit 9 [Cryptosporidium felis]|nr:Transcription initiation factor TFIID subunit 9 [Cryptosporidium felis]
MEESTFNEKYKQVIPESVASIERLLNEMNVNSYDPRIVDQLLNTAFALSQELLIKSNEYARMDSRFRIEECDVKIAVSDFYERNLVNQSSSLYNRTVSNEINSLPLPVFPSKGISKIWLPTEYEMSVTPNWRQDITSVMSEMNESENEKMSRENEEDEEETDK